MKAVLSSLEDAKAEDIVKIDLTGKTSLADTMLIATGRSNTTWRDRRPGRQGLPRSRVAARRASKGIRCAIGCSSTSATRSSTSSAPKCGSSTTSKNFGAPTVPAKPARAEGALRMFIFSVGRMKAGPERELLERYVKRIAALAPRSAWRRSNGANSRKAAPGRPRRGAPRKARRCSLPRRRALSSSRSTSVAVRRRARPSPPTSARRATIPSRRWCS